MKRLRNLNGKEFAPFLWALKSGALVNLYFLGRTLVLPLAAVDNNLLRPAQILFIVSAFRCLFPVRYKDNIVFHNSPFSSIFLTRLLATFAEVALIYQLAYVLRLLNMNQVSGVAVLSWGMVVQVIIAQIFVWGSILTGQIKLFYYEELGWGLIYAANTVASAYLYLTIDGFGGRALLLQINLLFGAVYLPWQFIHLRALQADAREKARREEAPTGVTWNTLARGLRRAIYVRNQAVSSQAWGGLIGIIWMTGYWATLIPLWAYQIVQVGRA